MKKPLLWHVTTNQVVVTAIKAKMNPSVVYCLDQKIVKGRTLEGLLAPRSLTVIWSNGAVLGVFSFSRKNTVAQKHCLYLSFSMFKCSLPEFSSIFQKKTEQDHAMNLLKHCGGML